MSKTSDADILAWLHELRIEEAREGKWWEWVWSKETKDLRMVLAETNFLRWKRWRNLVKWGWIFGEEEEGEEERDGWVERWRGESMGMRFWMEGRNVLGAGSFAAMDGCRELVGNVGEE